MTKINVLDHGFVELVDMMGDDQRIVDAARVSYQEGTKSVRDNAGLIDYLMRHKHTSPFEQVIFCLRIKLPIFVARQLIRHRTARLNEVSARYSVLPAEYYIPEPDQICAQNVVNKQGRAEPIKPQLAEMFRHETTKQCDEDFRLYDHWLDRLEIARETARIGLPLNTYTEWFWQIDLHNLFHLLQLRLDSHSQWEIRQYGEAIATIVREHVPLAWAAFENHILNAVTFSADEQRVLHNMMGDGYGNFPLKNHAADMVKGLGMDWSKGRLAEFVAKLEKINGRV